MNQQQPSYWFPTMKINEIITNLDEWGLPVTEANIRQPTGEVVQLIYSAFLQQLTGISREVLEDSVARALSVTDEFPELYAASLNMNFLLHHVHRLAYAARVQDFCMRDLVTPDPERTRSMLSAIINFVKFAMQQEAELKKFREHSFAALNERDRLAVEVIELRRRIAEIHTQRAEDEPLCRTLKEENAQITASLIATKGQQEALMKVVDGLKKDRSALTRQKESLASEGQLVKNSIMSTKSRIVQSPDRIKKHINEMGFMAHEERSIVMSNEMKSRELKAKLDALNVYEQDIKKCVDDLRIISDEHGYLQDAHSKLATFNNELEKRKIHREQLFGRAERARRQLEKADDKLNRTRRLAADLKKKTEEEIVRLTKEYAEMSEERRDNDRQVEELKQEASEIERKMNDHLRKNEAELNDLLVQYWTLRHQTEVYMETLTETLGMEIA